MTLDPETRQSLIAKLVSFENEEAWTEFVSIYQPVIQRFLTRYGLQYADAAEVTQEVLAGVAASINSWDSARKNSTFRGWLYRITRNKAVDLMRRKANSAKVNSNSNMKLEEIAQACHESGNADFEIEFERQIFMWAAEKIRPTVKPVNWLAFWKAAVEEQPIEKVASDLNVDRSVVYVARSRIMKRLIQLVQQKRNESLND